MAQYQIQDTQSGRTMTVEGDAPPSEQDAADLFAAHDAPPQLSEFHPTLGQKVSGILHDIRTSGPVEKIMGQTEDELAANPPAEGAPPAAIHGVSGLFESTKPVMTPTENPKTALEGLHNWAASVVNSGASPGGMALIASGGGAGAATPALVRKALGLAFGAQGVAMTYENAKDLVTHAFKNNAAQNVMDVGNILTGSLMTAGGKHALTAKPVETQANSESNLSRTKVEPLTHGDEVHAILPSGEQVQGTVTGHDEQGNAQILTPDGVTHTLPERMVTEDNANQEQGPVEGVRNPPPGTPAQVAEGESGEVQQPAGTLQGEEAGLPPEHQELIQQNLDAANGAGVRIINPDEATDENAPFASGENSLAMAHKDSGQILINGPEMSRWLDGIPQDKRTQAVRSVLSEEAIHLATPGDDALSYWKNLTKAEQWVVKKRYGTGNVEQSDKYWGYEAMRFRMQQAMHMTPTEYVNAMRGDRSMAALKTLTALESIVRGTRENILKTKASQESLALLDKAQNNINTAKFALGGGTPAAMSGEQSEQTAKDLEKQAQVYHKMGAHDEAQELMDMARWIRQKGDQQNMRNGQFGPNAMSGELPMEGGTGKKKFESKAEQLARLIGKKPTEGFVNTNKAGRPAAEKVDPFNKAQPVLWTKEGTPITAKTGTKPENVSTSELGLPQVPRNAEAIDQAAKEIVGAGMERASDAYKPGGTTLGGEVGMPSFEDFSRQMRQRNPELEYDQLKETYYKALGGALRNSSDNTLNALSKAEFGEPEKGTRNILPGGDELARQKIEQDISRLNPAERRFLQSKVLTPEQLAEYDRQEAVRKRLGRATEQFDFTAEQQRRRFEEGKKLASMTQEQRDAYVKERQQALAANRKFTNAPKEVSKAARLRQDDERMRAIQRNRSAAISRLFNSALDKVMRQDPGILHRKSITDADIQEGGYSFINDRGDKINTPSYQAIDPNGFGHDTIDALTQKNRRSSSDDWRTTKRVAVMQDKATGNVHMSSVFEKYFSEGKESKPLMGEKEGLLRRIAAIQKDIAYKTAHGKDTTENEDRLADTHDRVDQINRELRSLVGRKDIQFTDPRVPTGESGLELGPALLNRYRLLYSILLEHPVRNFHQEFKPRPEVKDATGKTTQEAKSALEVYEDGFGKDADRHRITGEGRYVDETAEEREAQKTGFRTSSKFIPSYMADASGKAMQVWTDLVSGEVVPRGEMTFSHEPGEEPMELAHIEGLPTTGVESSSSFQGPHADLVRDRVDQGRTKFSQGPLTRNQTDALREYLISKEKHGTVEALKQLDKTFHPRRIGAITAAVKISRQIAKDNPNLSVDELMQRTADRIHLAHVAAEKPADFAKILGVEQPKVNLQGEPAPPGKELTMPIDRRPPTRVNPNNVPEGSMPAKVPPAPETMPPKPATGQYLNVEDMKSAMDEVNRESTYKPTAKEISQAGEVRLHPVLNFAGKRFEDAPSAMSGEAKEIIESSKSRVLEGIHAYLSGRGNKETIPMLKDVAGNMAANAGYAKGKNVLIEQVNDHATISRALAKLAKGDFPGAYKTFADHLALKKQNLRQREGALAVLHSGAIVNKYRYSPSALNRMAEIREADPDFGLVDKLMKGDLVGVKAELMKRIDPNNHSQWDTMLYEINQIPEKLRRNEQQGEIEGGGVGTVSSELQKIGGKLYDLSMQKIQKQLINEGLLTHKDVKRNFDDSKKGRLDLFLSQLEGAKKDAGRIMADGNVAENIRQKARLREIERLQNGVEYAKAHWGDDEMNRVATAARKEFDDQFDREKDNGAEVRYDEDFVPGRYDAELFNNGEWGFHGSRGNKVLGTNTYDAKAFRNHYDAVSAGPYIAVTHDPAVLVEHRVRTGANRINKEQFKNSLLDMHDDNLGAPIAVKTKPNANGKPTPDVPKGVSRTMYKVSEADSDLAVLRGSYSRLVNRMLKPSSFDDSGALSTLLAGSQRLKHMALLGDIYHMSKMGLYSLASARGNFNKVNWRRGLSVLDYDEDKLDQAAASGMLDPRTVAWAKEKIPANINGQKTMVSRHGASQMLQRQGYNVGQIQDAIYKDIASSVPKILGAIPGVNTDMLNKFQKSTFGRYNKFLFDEWTRGLMGSRGVEEFERLQRLDPTQSSEVIARKVAKDLNVLFGNIGNQGWIQNKTFRDFSRMVFLAPQWAEGLVKKDLSLLRFIGAPHTVLSGRESLAAPIGLGFVGMLAATQVLNIIQNGHPTWQNKDKNHLMDYKMGDNIYISPLSVYNEMLHDFVRYHETEPTTWGAIQRIGENKLGFPGRAAMVLIKQQNQFGEKITSTGGILKAAAGQLVPVPITAGKPLWAIGHAIAPGMVAPNAPGDMLKQAFASLGIKAEIGRKASAQMQDLAHKFMKANNLPTGEIPQSTDEPSYGKLRRMVDMNDTAGAKSMLAQLRSNHTDQQILRAMAGWAKRPFTGSKTAERQWLASLSDDELKDYQAAISSKYDLLQKWEDFYQKQ